MVAAQDPGLDVEQLLRVAQVADEVGIAGVKVCYVAPGGTKTGLATPKDPRFLEPAAVAEAIAFVCESGADTWVRDLTVLPLGL